MRERIPYDEEWKWITTDLFEDFVAMFLPSVYERVDWSVPVKFLEQELKAVAEGDQLKIADKLVGVQCKDNTIEWIYIHIEFESHPKISIGARIDLLQWEHW